MNGEHVTDDAGNCIIQCPGCAGTVAPFTSNDQTERYYAEMEAARNQAEDEYFKARPQLARTISEETLFRAGFERAFKAAWDRESKAVCIRCGCPALRSSDETSGCAACDRGVLTPHDVEATTDVCDCERDGYDTHHHLCRKFGSPMKAKEGQS